MFDMRLRDDVSDQPQMTLKRKALTTKMETMSLKLDLRIALVGEKFLAASLPESEVHIIFVLCSSDSL